MMAITERPINSPRGPGKKQRSINGKEEIGWRQFLPEVEAFQTPALREEEEAVVEASTDMPEVAEVISVAEGGLDKDKVVAPFAYLSFWRLLLLVLRLVFKGVVAL